jgi:microsomal epoxide hydrolase
MAGFSDLPPSTKGEIKPFQVHVLDEDIAELNTLLGHSRVGPQTYENGPHGGQLGLRREWLVDAVGQWKNFDWFVLIFKFLLLRG